MNNQLKFRAWDSRNQEMRYSDIHDGEFYKTYEVMQFTGLKDKNNKEIFEGDILEFKNELGKHVKHTVFRVEGGLAINAHNSDFGKETPFYDACADPQTAAWIRQCAVIGNIYQNADLLPKEE